MKKRFERTLKTLRYNLRTLIVFEIIYRVFGAIVIFPLAGSLFFLSIRMSGFRYVSNAVFFDFLLQPSTILILFFMLLVLNIYVLIEMIFLSVIFHFSYNERTIKLKGLLRTGVRKTKYLTKRYHIFVLLPAFFFFVLVQLLHVAGIASTLSLPPVFVEQLSQFQWLMVMSAVLFFLLVFLFIESLFFLNFFTIEDKPVKETLAKNRRMLKKSRGKIILEFFLLNFLLNLMVYIFYGVLVALVAFLIFITRGQALVLGILVTVLYLLYLLVGFLATLILTPVNFAWMSTWYHDRRKDLDISIEIPENTKDMRLPLPAKWVKRLAVVTAVVVFILNTVTVVAVVREPRNPMQLFRYPEIVAHRGASLDAPENTIAAIELAIEMDADAVEFDVRLTSDGVPILMHDSSLRRTTDDPEGRLVRDVTFEEIRELDAGSWFSEEFAGEQIPTLEEAMLMIRGESIAHVELKVTTPGIEAMVVDLIEELDMVDDVVVYSFYSSQLEQIKALNEDIETLYLFAAFFGDINRIVDLDHVDNFGFESHLATNNPDYIRAIQNAGKGLYVWTVNHEDRLFAVSEAGVDGIITDDPLLAREIAYTRYTRSIYRQLLRELFDR